MDNSIASYTTMQTSELNHDKLMKAFSNYPNENTVISPLITKNQHKSQNQAPLQQAFYFPVINEHPENQFDLNELAENLEK
jgi:hypothetical protein